MAHADLDALLNFLLSFARQMVSKHGEFHPFGASMNDQGQISAFAADTGSEFPESTEVIELLEGSFRQLARKGEIRASGICLDVRISAPEATKMVDAIQAKLEHKNGEAANVILPYRRGFLGRTKYGQISASQGTPQIFV